jgi:hypothetical protein
LISRAGNQYAHTHNDAALHNQYDLGMFSRNALPYKTPNNRLVITGPTYNITLGQYG